MYYKLYIYNIFNSESKFSTKIGEKSINNKKNVGWTRLRLTPPYIRNNLKAYK